MDIHNSVLIRIHHKYTPYTNDLHAKRGDTSSVRSDEVKNIDYTSEGEHMFKRGIFAP